MNLISNDMVSRCLLAELQVTVNALIELAESESHNHTLLSLVKRAIKDEFYRASQGVTAKINDLVRKYNERECVTAGVSPEEKAKPNENGSFDTGHTIWMNIKKIGIRRIGENVAFQLTIDDEAVPCTGMPEELAIRLFKAIDAFRNAREKKEKAPC